MGLALLVDTVGRDNIGQWMGTALSSSSFGLIVSPLLGGIVYAKAGYMAVFAMAMSLIIVDILMRLFMIEKKTAAKYMPLKSVMPENGFYGTFTDRQPSEHEHSNGSMQPNKPHHDPEHAPLLNNGVEEPLQKQSRMPTIIVLLGSPRLLAAIYGIFVNVSILAAFDGVLPLYVKKLFHWDSLAAGLIFLCIAIPALTGPLVGKLSDKFGPRRIAVAGCSLTAPPLILLRLVAHDSDEQKVLLCGLLVCCGWYPFVCCVAHVPIVHPPIRVSLLVLSLCLFLSFSFPKSSSNWCKITDSLLSPPPGFTLILIVSPLAADLSAVVEEKEKTDPGIFGPGGAYAQAFALFNCSMAAATLFGPVAAGALIERYDWGVVTAAMGVFAFSGAIPAVSLPARRDMRFLKPGPCGDEILTGNVQFLYTGGWIFGKD